ncbi:MAG: hypothetical protein Kow0069_30110 [Promethearchaeota archaeon]
MNENDYPLKIIVDTREPVAIRDHLENVGVAVEVAQLDVGDYVVSRNLVVERKRAGDFTSSLTDNRLFENLARAKEAYPRVILLLERFQDVFEGPHLDPNSVYGALAYCAYKMGVSVVPTNGKLHTAIFLKRLAVREQVRDAAPVLARVAPKGMDLEQRRQHVLEGLVKTGPVRAKALLEHFKTPGGVFDAIRRTRVLYTRAGRPRGLSGPLGRIKGLGPTWVVANAKVLFGKAAEPPSLDAALRGGTKRRKK